MTANQKRNSTTPPVNSERSHEARGIDFWWRERRKIEWIKFVKILLTNVQQAIQR